MDWSHNAAFFIAHAAVIPLIEVVSMEVSPKELVEGQVFWGMNLYGTYPSFLKLQVVKATGKQVKALDTRNTTWRSEQTLRTSDWRFFSTFEAAKEVWIKERLDADIAKAEAVLGNKKALRDEMISKSEL